MAASKIESHTQLFLFDRCGNPKRKLTETGILYTFVDNVLTVHENLKEFLLLESLPLERIQSHVFSILDAYYSSKLANLRLKVIEKSLISGYFTDLFGVFESLLLQLSSNPQCDNTIITLILVLGLFLSSMAKFMGDNEKEYTEEGLVLLISHISSAQLLEAFKTITPPAYKLKLFVLAQRDDLNRLEDRLRKDSSDQISKLKPVKTFIILKYGDSVFSNYTEDVLLTFSEDNIFNCPAKLWTRAVDKKSKLHTSLGPSFIVNLIKLQWGIIKDSNCVVTDGSIETLYLCTEIDNLFFFLNDQAQQLFILAMTLHNIISNDSEFRPNLTSDSETLKIIYTELLNHLQNIIKALQESYKVESQGGEQEIKNLPKLLQEAKFHALLLFFCLCALNDVLEKDLKMKDVPFIGSETGSFFEEVDYFVHFPENTITIEFSKHFQLFKTQMTPQFPILTNLSPYILRVLEGVDLKQKMALYDNTNFLTISYFVLMCFAVVPILLSHIIEKFTIFKFYTNYQ